MVAGYSCDCLGLPAPGFIRRNIDFAIHHVDWPPEKVAHLPNVLLVCASLIWRLGLNVFYNMAGLAQASAISLLLF